MPSPRLKPLNYGINWSGLLVDSQNRGFIDAPDIGHPRITRSIWVDPALSEKMRGRERRGGGLQGPVEIRDARVVMATDDEVPDLVISTFGGDAAFDGKDGSTIWTQPEGLPDQDRRAVSIIIDEHSLICGWRWGVCRRDPGSGEVNWEYRRGSALEYGVAQVACGGRLYSAWKDKHLTCIDTKSGELLWERAFPKSLQNFSGIAADDETLVVTNEDSVYALDASTGRAIWSVKFRSLTVAPVIDDGCVYVRRWDGLSALSLDDGSLKWEAISIGQPGSIRRPLAAAVVTREHLICNSERDLYCLDKSDGSTLWSRKLEGRFWRLWFATEGAIYLSDHKRAELIAVDIETGQNIWLLPLSIDRLTFEPGALYVIAGNRFVVIEDEQ
jgi:outer membrane protein assembly factor BamB